MKLRKLLFAVVIFMITIFGVNASNNSYSFLDTNTPRPNSIPESFVIKPNGNGTAFYYDTGERHVVRIVDDVPQYGTQSRVEPIFKINRDTGVSVYCIEGSEGEIFEHVNNIIPYGTTSIVHYKGLIVDPGLVYLVKNTNGKGADTRDSYTINQFAFWFYMHEVYGGSYSSLKTPHYRAKNYPWSGYEKLPNAAASLSNAAKKIHDEYKKPSMGDLKIASNELEVLDGYLISEEIEVPLTNISKYNVSVDNGVVIDNSGNVRDTFNAGEKFRVRVDNIKNVDVNVTVKTSYQSEAVTIYRRTDKSNSQDIITPYIVVITNKLSKSLKLSYKLIGDVEVSKVDATTGKEVAGATLIIRDSNGKEVASWVSTNEVHKVKLVPGVYTLEETIAPDGYILSKEKVTFTVKEDGTCDKVVMKNEPIKDIEFSKQDATTGKEVAGATLIIRNSKGKEIASWVSTNEVHKVKLVPGVYTLEETIAPDGYILSKEKVTFTVKEDGTCDKVVMLNAPKSSVEFSKQDATTGKEVPGAHLSLRDKNGKLIEEWVSTIESHYVKLVPGVYTLEETIAPDGYILSKEKVTFTVKEDGTCDKVVMLNEPILVDVELSKIDATTGSELPGAHLSLRDSDGNLVEEWISSNEIHKVKLVPGVYTLEETIAPDGYELSTEKITFTVKEDGTCDKVVMKNIPYVPVPPTSLDVSIITYIVGAVLLAFGGLMVYKYERKEF